MSTNFSANQYENSFAAKRLQNWQSPKNFKEHPSSKNGATVPISNDRGHLLEGVPRSNASPWGNFKGTWDMGMDCRLTAHCQTLTTLKSEGASCLNNQTKKMKQLQSDLTISNKKFDKIFQGIDDIKPDRSGSPLKDMQEREQSPVGHDIKVASPVQPVEFSAMEDKAQSPVQPGTPKSPVYKETQNSPSPVPLGN